MRFVKYIVILPLCLLLGSCPAPDVEINIGDYDEQLEAWNYQNMLNYQLLLVYYYEGYSKSKQAVVTVKNGIPESSDPADWLASGEKSNIPDFFSFIKEQEKKFEKGRFFQNSYHFKVGYNSEYHYPYSIQYYSFNSSSGPYTYWRWDITLTPLEE